MDWERLKQEYITSNISYRKLAEKYNVSSSSLMERGAAEGWVQLREQFRSKTVAKTIEKASDTSAKRAASLTGTADRLLKEVVKLIDSFSSAKQTMPEATIKTLTGALKDIKAVKEGKSELDLEEQRARIAILKKQAADEKKAETITIELGAADEYGG